jgi:FkbM family methyltransferase
MRVDRAEGHTFLPLPNNPTVIDLGYNRGQFSTYVTQKYQARVIALEPDPTIPAAPSPGVDLRRIALGNGDRSPLFVGENGDASLTRGATTVAVVETVRLGALLREHDAVHLVKMDVEGAEYDALALATDDDLARVDQIAVEFHDFLDPTLRYATDATRTRMQRAGFQELRFSRDNSDILFVNRQRRPLRRVACAWLVLRHRYVRGLSRVLKRTVRR